MPNTTLLKISDGKAVYDGNSRTFMFWSEDRECWQPYTTDVAKIVLCGRYGLSRTRHKRQPSEVDLAMKEIRLNWRRKFKRPKMWLEGTNFCMSTWELIDEDTN